MAQMDPVKFTAIELARFGKHYAAKHAEVFNKMFPGNLTLKEKYVLAGLGVLDKLKSQVDRLPAEQKSSIPVAQIAASIGLLTSDPTPQASTFEEFKMRIRFHELKDAEIADDKEHDAYISSVNDSSIDLDQGMRDFSSTDGSVDDYGYDAYVFTDLNLSLRPEPTDGEELDDDDDELTPN